MPSKANVYSVSKINSYINGLFLQEGIFRNVHVKGEVGTLNPWNYGIVYLTLKGDGETLKCQLSAECVRLAGFEIKKGMTITLVGNIVANTSQSAYILKANKAINDNNIGKDQEELLKLINELKEEGMFDPQYKRPIPRTVKCLGVVTSETGAVINDIIRVSKERNPYIKIVLSPSKVSGANAVEQMVSSIKQLEEYGVDVIIVGRGGGSDEELWVYNNRMIAEAVFDCSVPVISAVGHEINLSVLDLVADLSVATPSMAAEKAVANIYDEIDRLINYENRLNNTIKAKLSLNRVRIENYANKLKLKSPKASIENKKVYLLSVEEKLRASMMKVLNDKQHSLGIYIEKFKGLSPLDKLSQGYTYTSINDKTLTSISQVNIDDMISVYVKDGILKAKVCDIDEVKYE